MKHFACICLSVALLAACRKDDVVVCDPVSPNAAADARATFADLRAAAPPVQTFSFDLTQAQSLRTKGGATLAFGPNAYLLPNGTVATGQAQLRVREIYSVPDMVLADMPTTAASSRQVLVSGGEFTIQVWQNSSRLRMAAVSPTGVSNRLVLTSPVPPAGLDTTPMLLWLQPAAGTLRDSSGWLLSNPSPGGVTTSAGYYSAALPLDSIGNWNIDQFWHAYQTNSSGQVGVEVPTAPTGTTRVYFRPVGYNGLARGYASSTSPTRWNSSLPYGADVIAIVLHERAGLLYYGTQRLTTAAGAVATPTLEALGAAEIVRRIRQL